MQLAKWGCTCIEDLSNTCAQMVLTNMLFYNAAPANMGYSSWRSILQAAHGVRKGRHLTAIYAENCRELIIPKFVLMARLSLSLSLCVCVAPVLEPGLRIGDQRHWGISMGSHTRTKGSMQYKKKIYSAPRT